MGQDSYVENIVKKAKDFDQAKRAPSMSGLFLDYKPLIKEKAAVRLSNQDRRFMGTESKVQPVPRMSVKVNDRTPEPGSGTTVSHNEALSSKNI